MSWTWIRAAETLIRSLLRHTVPGGLSYAEQKAMRKEIAERMNEAARTRDLGSDRLYTEDAVLTYYIT